MTGAATAGATWSTWREISGVLIQPQHLKRTAMVALIVGSAFFAMNQLGAVLAGEATPLVWLKAVLTYLTPLCVSSVGVLSATHRRVENGRGGSRGAVSPINQGGAE